jgi:hypothetical protein
VSTVAPAAGAAALPDAPPGCPDRPSRR